MGNLFIYKFSNFFRVFYVITFNLLREWIEKFSVFAFVDMMRCYPEVIQVNAVRLERVL